MPEHLGEDFGAGAGGHGLLNEVSGARGEEAVAPEDVDVGGLGGECGVGEGRRY